MTNIIFEEGFVPALQGAQWPENRGDSFKTRTEFQGQYDFRRSFDLCAHEDCNVVWINTCAALIKGKEANFQDIDYVRKRISRNEDEAQMLYKMAICEGAFKGECAHDCIYSETIQGV